MHTKKILLICLMVAWTLSSCKNYLDVAPMDKLTPEQAFATENTLQLYTNSFNVNMLPDGPAIYQGDVMADNTVPNNVPDLLRNSVTANNTSGWSWGSLRNINYFLENYNNPAISLAARNNYAGIARFFRAWFYFNMVKRYGDVPWYGHTLAVSDPDLYKARDPRKLVMDSVLADLNFACANITAVKDNSCSNITKWVALAFKSRVCLFEGSFRKYHTELYDNVDEPNHNESGLTGTANDWFREAADAASQVMMSGQYKLVNTGAPEKDYRSLFISENPPSDEVMLAAVYSNSLKKWHNATWWYASATLGARLGLAKSFINTYLDIDGTRFTDKPGYSAMEFHDEVKNRDMRLQQTIRAGDYRRTDGSPAPPDFTVTYSGYQIKKFSLDDKYYDTRTESYNSIPIIRYAEVLLNYAEAKAELGPLSSSDWDLTVGALRRRAGITNTAMPTVPDPYMEAYFPGVHDAALLEVMRERGIELVAEGIRFDDLKRWKQGQLLEKVYDGIYVPAKGQLLDLNEDGKPDVAFVDQVPSSKVPGVVYFGIDNSTSKLSEGDHGNLLWLGNIQKTFVDDTHPEKKYYYPIPATEIIQNPKLKQNPGW